MRDFLKWLGLAIAIATAIKAVLDTPEFAGIQTPRNPNA